MFYTRRKAEFYWFLLFVFLFASCTVVKNYPANKPFVFANKINLKGDVSKDEKKRLQLELMNYWDDSTKVNSVLTYGIRTVIKNPPAYDSTSVSKSVLFMSSYLISQGYYNADIIADSIKIDSAKSDQERATVQVSIDLHKNVTIDSVSYDSILNPQLRQLALDNVKESFLKKGSPFSNALVNNELDRLVTLYRRNGFYKLNREYLYAEVDTIDASLLEVTFDPFEQAQKIAEAASRRKVSPTIHVLIRQRPNTDTSTLLQYTTGNIYFYPETDIRLSPDSLLTSHFKYEDHEGYFYLKQNGSFIKMSPLREHSFMKRGNLYNEQNYVKTVNALSGLGPWNQVDVKVVERVDSPRILDYHFFMTPAPKYPFGYDLEVSRNSGSIIAGNLLGISNVLTLRNRNVWKRAIQSSTVIRVGVELGFTDTVLQTIQASISQTYSIPKILWLWKIKNLKTLDDYKTLVNFNLSYTDRRNFFRLRSGVASFGWDWKKKNRNWIVRFPNIELYSLDTLTGLKNAFVTNPFLRTAFNTGYVTGENATFTLSWPNKRKPNILNNFRVSAEESGGIVGTLAKSLKDKIYQYIKLETEYRKVIQWRKTSIAYRAFGGIGINYSNDPVLGKSLPFFKQFVAGGPYSMRAWGVRQLGLGSSLLSDTNTTFRDRFGDIQLEANIEYRFSLFAVGSMKVNSAVFVDIGNIWNLKNDVDNPDSKLALNKLYNDIAIAAGIGLLRLDFGYFLIRVDFAYKVKDPTRLANNGWMSLKDFEWRNHEFDIKDGNGKELIRNNYSFQLGIGLPF